MSRSREEGAPGSGPRRRLVASSRSFAPDERLDRLVHALAQLSDNVSLEICGDEREAGSLALLADAYGIRDRVAFRSHRDPETSDAQVVYPSRVNQATAPIAPAAVDGEAIVLSPGGPSPAAQSVGTMGELVHALSAPTDPPAATREDDDALAGQRVAIVTNVPTHYRVPLFNALDQRLRRAGAQLRVLFTGTAREPRDWMRTEPIAFEADFLRSITRLGRVGAVPLDLERRLARFSPTTVVSSGFAPAVSARVARFATGRGIGFGIWSGEIGSRPTAQGRLRRLERQWILRRAGFAIAYGSSSADYLHAIAPTLPVVVGRNTAPFERDASRTRGAEAEVEALAVARAVPQKRLDTLVRAFSELGDLGCRLTVAGSGPALPSLIELARGHDNVRFLGAVASDRVADAFAAADLFLFPSTFDVFGLALVEAFAAGCATVTSEAPGCVADLAVDDRNCVVLDEHDSRAWARAVRRLVEDRELRRRLAEAARSTVEQRWTLDHAVDAMVAGLRLGLLSDRPMGGTA